MTDEPRVFSASCYACNVGVTSDADGTARWAAEHVGQLVHRESLARSLTSGREVDWAAVEAGEHCVTIRRLHRSSQGVIVFRAAAVNGRAWPHDDDPRPAS